MEVLYLYLHILQGKKTTLESNAITLIVRIATRHPRTARSCGSTHGTPTQWIPMARQRQFNKTLMKQNEQALSDSKRQAPAPPIETTGMHARLSLTNHKKNANVVVRRTQCPENLLLSFRSYDVPY